MCCCCFKRHGWTFTVFLITIAIALLVFAAVLGVYIYFGGPLPTEKFDHGTKAIFTANIITAFVLSLAILVIQKEWKSVATFVFVLILILAICAASFYVCYVFAESEPTEDEISDYVKNWAQDPDRVGKAPPVLDYIQRLIPCCGGEGFEDFIPLEKRPIVLGLTFTVPDSCCTSFHENPKYRTTDCGKDLTYVNYNNSMWFHERLKVYLGQALETAKDLHELKHMLLEDFTTELQKSLRTAVDNILEQKKLPPFDPKTGEFEPMYIDDRAAEESGFPIFIEQHLAAYINQCEDALKKQGIDPSQDPNAQLGTFVMNGLDAQVDQIAQVKIWEVLPINVYGCGLLLAQAKDAKMLLPLYREAYVQSFVAIFGFTVAQAVLNCVCLLLYNVSYWSLVHMPKQALPYTISRATAGTRATTASATTRRTMRQPQEQGPGGTPTQKTVAPAGTVNVPPPTQAVSQRPRTRPVDNPPENDAPTTQEKPRRHRRPRPEPVDNYAANDFTTPRTPMAKSRAKLPEE